MPLDKNESLLHRVLAGVLAGLIMTFLTISLAVALEPASAAAQEKTIIYHGARPSDYADLLLLKESAERMIWIASFVVILILAAAITYRTSHVKDEIVKKVEDEFNEIKEVYNSNLDPKTQTLVDQNRLNVYKDVFQTIAQGQAALWKRE